MHRCQEDAGRYRVSFQFLDSNGIETTDEYIAPLGPHEAIWVHSKTKDVYEGQDPPMDAHGDPDPRWEKVEDCPRVSNREPYVGDLCPHELTFVRSLPGKLFNGHWRYTVEKEG